jgi:hypothetical protein
VERLRRDPKRTRSDQRRGVSNGSEAGVKRPRTEMKATTGDDMAVITVLLASIDVV